MSRLYFEKKIGKILRHLDLAKGEAGITFVTDRVIKRLNRKYRKKNKATDVLSFPVGAAPCGRPSIRGNHGGLPLLGDIIISSDTLHREAKRLKKPSREHALFLMIHGILHLLGYDHVKIKDWKKMRKKEEELVKVVLDR